MTLNLIWSTRNNGHLSTTNTIRVRLISYGPVQGSYKVALRDPMSMGTWTQGRGTRFYADIQDLWFEDETPYNGEMPA